MNPELTRDLANRLNAEHAELMSWRKVAVRYHPGVAPGTLCRIAKSGGVYLPKDRKILRLLGLVERRPRTAMEKRIGRMARDEGEEVRVIIRSVTEAYCYSCDRVWSGRNAGVLAKSHADHTGHRVRVVKTIVQVYNNQNGKRAKK